MLSIVCSNGNLNENDGILSLITIACGEQIVDDKMEMKHVKLKLEKDPSIKKNP